MKKLFLLASIFILTGSAALNAQVTIGSTQAPNSDAVLELVSPSNNKGFLPPRIGLLRPHSPSPLSAHVPGMVVYNTFNYPDSLVVGLYVNNGTRWVPFREAPHLMPNWFYMPSFPLDVSATGTFTVDLWWQYQRHFDPSASIIRSDIHAPSPLPRISDAEGLYYYVIGYDQSVFKNITLASNGILTYQIDAAGLNNVSDSTFMNIVFTVK